MAPVPVVDAQYISVKRHDICDDRRPVCCAHRNGVTIHFHYTDPHQILMINFPFCIGCCYDVAPESSLLQSHDQESTISALVAAARDGNQAAIQVLKDTAHNTVVLDGEHS